MFERRLKIFLLFLTLATCALMVRALDVQVIQHDDWKKEEVKLQKMVQLTETTRGRILDVQGREMAVDMPCTDACVDYRAMIDPPDKKWVAQIAAARIKNRLGSDYSKTSNAELRRLRETEAKNVVADIGVMWKTLGELNKPGDDGTDPGDAVEELRQKILQDVEMRRRLVWYRNFKASQIQASEAPGWKQWLSGNSADGPDISTSVSVAEETESHAILRALTPGQINFLGKRLEGSQAEHPFPGLVLRPSMHRVYPMKSVGCHALGWVSRASAGDNDMARSLGWDETRIYRANDVSGHTGVESLCEPLLRGSRGKIERRVGDDSVVGDPKEFVPGRDVYTTIDAELQAEAQEMLKHVRLKKLVDGKYTFVTPEPGLDMHGAAVVIEIKTGNVLVLASNPDFDVNDLEQRYTALSQDHLDDPLRDRATIDAFAPGSTVKPMIGLGAITDGVLEPLEGVECTGNLELPVYGPDGKPTGRKMRQPTGRCWVASEHAEELWTKYHLKPIHHIIPFDAPHKGHDGYADGWLSYSDALERSCNVFFETVADRLKQPRVTYWYDQFGFGRKTGIGIAERPGLIPHPNNRVDARMENCFSGMGQGKVQATPLQIANEAATIARNGIWMRPRLLRADTQSELDGAHPRPASMPADELDLHLDPSGLAQAKLGMREVVNGGSAGTGEAAHLDDIEIAGKTGTAETTPVWILVDGPNGTKVRALLTPVSDKNPETPTPWYRESDMGRMTLAWFMGYAPANDPQVAFCVLIEYAGAGGGTAACPVADDILEACVQHGYLHPNLKAAPVALAH